MQGATPFLLFSLLLLALLAPSLADFQVGSGIYDITGPVAELRFFGYANIGQTGEGLHLRLRSRAYFVTDENGSNIVLVGTDLWAISDHIKTEVLKRLETLIPGQVNYANLLIGCTHTHSGPGGYDEYFLFNLPALGFSGENYEVVVSGIVESIVRAYNNRMAAQILVNKGDIEGVAVNRSPPPYANNPAEERARYNSDVDKEMVLMKFLGNDGTEIGTIGYHAVHAVSMKLENRLVSSDNKGYAAALFEKAKGTNYQSKMGFAAAFPIANAGDVSPNTGGTIPETGELIGEGKDYFESTLISATRIFEQALKIYDTATEVLTGSLDYRTTNVDMSNVFIESLNVSTVPAALGYSFTAGTADGIAFGMQYQGLTEINPVLERVSKIIANYSDDFQLAHGKKPILLPVGVTKPRPMVPHVLNLQLLRIGQLAIIGLPAEITTMAGRRLKETILEALSDLGVKYVTISALTNGYSQYIVTREEYDIQWYEGATTYFGPWTLAAYQQEYEKLAVAMVKGAAVPEGPALEPGKTREILPEHRYDEAPEGTDFGDIITDVKAVYLRGLEVASVSFIGANPRSNLRIQGTYLNVEYLDGAEWVSVADDSVWETKFRWQKNGRTMSNITIEWEIPASTPRGSYRIRYFGDSKSRLTGRVTPFEGVSSTFQVE